MRPTSRGKAGTAARPHRFETLTLLGFAVLFISAAMTSRIDLGVRYILPVYPFVHAAIGLGEALITGLVLRFILLTRPDLVYPSKLDEMSRPRRWAHLAVAGLAVALAVAAYIMAAYWFTASTSFANPAVTLARAATDTFAGIRPADAPPFIAAQVLGAFAATALFRWLLPSLPAREVLVPHNGGEP